MLDIKFIEDIYLPSILRHKGINYFPYLSYPSIMRKQNNSKSILLCEL